MKARLRTTIIFIAALGLIAACGPRAQHSASVLRGVPEELSASTTTSTTSTTIASDTTSTSVAVEPVTLYVILENRLIQTSHDLPSGATEQDVLDELLGLSDDPALGSTVRSALPKGLTASVTVERGLAIVDTGASLLTDISPLDQRLAIGQIVLTLTSRPGVGQVSFFVDGKPQSVPRGGGDLASAGSPVAYDDYIQLVTPSF
jgi:spore germination protein GerM